MILLTPECDFCRSVVDTLVYSCDKVISVTDFVKYIKGKGWKVTFNSEGKYRFKCLECIKKDIESGK